MSCWLHLHRGGRSYLLDAGEVRAVEEIEGGGAHIITDMRHYDVDESVEDVLAQLQAAES